MHLNLPVTFAINERQEVALFVEGVGFIYEGNRLVADLHFELKDEALEVTFSDDASWVCLQDHGTYLQGRLYSHLKAPIPLTWQLNETAMRQRPQAKSMLQAVRFYDMQALAKYDKQATKEQLSEMLIEAATCGHEKLVDHYVQKGAVLSVNEAFKEEDKASCMALIKAVQYGHVAVVQRLLEAQARIHHHTFDLDRDAFYHACFLYQVRPKKGEAIIKMMLDRGVDFSRMSTYYLCAVMVIYPEGPLEMAKEDTKMLRLLLESKARNDDFMAIDAWDKDTALMYAAHMGLLEPLKVLVDYKANIFESFRGKNALDRVLYPLIEDPLMPTGNRKAVRILLERMGLESNGPMDQQEERMKQKATEVTQEDLSSLENLFKKI